MTEPVDTITTKALIDSDKLILFIMSILPNIFYFLLNDKFSDLE